MLTLRPVKLERAEQRSKMPSAVNRHTASVIVELHYHNWLSVRGEEGYEQDCARSAASPRLGRHFFVVVRRVLRAVCICSWVADVSRLGLALIIHSTTFCCALLVVRRLLICSVIVGFGLYHVAGPPSSGPDPVGVAVAAVTNGSTDWSTVMAGWTRRSAATRPVDRPLA